jgi:hypothetical protein
MGNEARRNDGVFMQTIYDLTDEEIANLADDAINMFIEQFRLWPLPNFGQYVNP